jgi:hypothetical protein
MPTANDRIFYACQGVAIQGHGHNDNVATNEMIHGLQSVGVTTNFALEQAFELGQIEIYENIEGTPDIEVTLEKVLDGNSLIYHLATTGIGNGPSGLVNRSKQRADVRLGNNKQWFDNVNGKMVTGGVANFDGLDEPLGLGSDTNPSGGITQKEDIMLSGCIFPASIQGISGSGYANAVGKIHAQSVSVSTDFSREDIFELGRKTPYARPAAFPIEVTCDIEAITTSGDFVEAFEGGDTSLHSTVASGNNTTNECIFIYTRNGLALDLGAKNRLSSVSYGGGDAGGGNATCTYSYSNYNDLDVQMRTNGYVGFNALKGTLTGADKAKTSADGLGEGFPAL